MANSTKQDILTSLGIRATQLNLADIDNVYARLTNLLGVEQAKADANGNKDNDFSVNDLSVNKDLIPLSTDISNIGTAERKFNEVYAQSLYLYNQNVLFVDDEPVILYNGTDLIFETRENDNLIFTTTGENGTTIFNSDKEIDLNVEDTNIQVTDGNVNINADSTTVNGTSMTFNAELVGKETATFKKNVTIEGDLYIKGSTTEVSTTELKVVDNIIELNKDEANEGVTAGFSGLQINRGTADDSYMVFDESDDEFKIGTLSSLKKVASKEWVTDNFTHPETHPASMIVESETQRFITDTERTSWNNKVDKEEGKGLSANDFTDTLKTKLDGIEENANNYTHPSTHPAAVVVQDTTHRFVSDTEKSAWNIKLDGKAGKSAFKGGSDEVTIAHGLSAAPTAVTVTPSATANGTLGEYWVRWDATNIYVGNTGSATVAFSWIAIV